MSKLHFYFFIGLTVSWAGPAQAASLTQGGDPGRCSCAPSASRFQGPLKEAWIGQLPVGGGPVRQNPLIAGSRVLVVQDRRLSALDRANGTLLWSTALSSTAHTGTIDAHRGLVYTVSKAGDLSAYRWSDGSLAWRRPSAGGSSAQADLGGPVLAENKIIYPLGGGLLGAVDADTRALLWSRAMGGDRVNPIAYDNGELWATSTNGWGKYSLSDGAVDWESWCWDPGMDNRFFFTLGPERAYFPSNAWPYIESIGRGLSARTYQTREPWGDEASMRMSLAAGNERLIVANDRGNVTGFGTGTDTVFWERSLGGALSKSRPFIACNTVYVTGDQGQYFSMDSTTGKVLWTIDHDSPNTSADWAADEGQLYVTDAKHRLRAFKPNEPFDEAQACSTQPGPPAEPEPGPCREAEDPRLRVFLDADQAEADPDGKLSWWKDLSGQGHDAVNIGTRRPTLSGPDSQGHRWTAFDGVNDRLYLNRSSELFEHSVTLALVIRPLDARKTQIVLGAWDPNGLTRRATGDWISVMIDQGNWAVHGFPAVTPGQAQVLILRYVAHKSVTVRLNGQQAYHSTNNVRNFYNRAPWSLGHSRGALDQYFKGEVNKVLIYDGELSDADLERVESCLLFPSIRTATPTKTPTPTLSATSTFTPSATPTATPSATLTPTASMTASATPTPSPTRTQTPDWTHTATPTITATSTPAPPEDGHCPAKIESLVLVPNPWGDGCERRHAKVKLACSVDKVEVVLYSGNGTQVCSFAKAKAHVYKGDWLQLDFPEHLKLPNGTYYCKVSAHKGISSDSQVKALVLLR